MSAMGGSMEDSAEGGLLNFGNFLLDSLHAQRL